MKKYFQHTLQMTPRIWAILALEITFASLLYAFLSTFGVPKGTSFLVTLGVAFGLVLFGLLLIPKSSLTFIEGTSQGSSLGRLWNHLKKAPSKEPDDEDKSANEHKGVLPSGTSEKYSIIQPVTKEEDFDVLLLYNSENRNEVEEIAKALKNSGIKPWFDQWELRPGELVLSKVVEQLHQTKAVAIFFGKDAFSTWQQAFLNSLIDREAIIIPVLLRDAPQELNLPPALEMMNPVDFRKQSPNPIEPLVRGITETR